MSHQPRTLRVLRAQHGFSQKAIAEKLSISIAQYSKIESGEKPLQIEFLIKLGEIFHLSPWQLLEDIMDNKGTTREFFQGKAASEARKKPFDAAKDREELIFYKNLAAHYEEKYMTLFSQFVERNKVGDPLKM